MEAKLGRRRFLQLGAGAAVTGLALGGFGSKALAAATCALTPPQTPGPFYPGEVNFTAENDLTRVNGQKALGQVVYITGKVLDPACGPISGANVEIWQACASGRYNNSKDPNAAPLDPNFRYWGETFTNTAGEYSFKTIIPGAYPADEGWDRPPHIHVRVAKLGYKDLVTQMYFKGEPLNDKDFIFLDIPENERELVVVDFKPAGVGFEPGSLTGEFNLTLRSVR